MGGEGDTPRAADALGTCVGRCCEGWHPSIHPVTSRHLAGIGDSPNAGYDSFAPEVSEKKTEYLLTNFTCQSTLTCLMSPFHTRQHNNRSLFMMRPIISSIIPLIFRVVKFYVFMFHVSLYKGNQYSDILC